MRRNIPVRFIVQPDIYFHLVILLFLFPLSWVFAWTVAIVFHELCHYLSVKIFRGRIDSVKIGFGGFQMRCSALADWQNVISILSAPLCGFALVFIGRWLPKVAICSFFLSFYNILPLLPLDGGRALQFLMGNSRSFWIFEKLVLLILFLGAVYCCFSLHLGMIPLLFVMVLWLRYRKIPCKEQVYKVQ